MSYGVYTFEQNKSIAPNIPWKNENDNFFSWYIRRTWFILFKRVCGITADWKKIFHLKIWYCFYSETPPAGCYSFNSSQWNIFHWLWSNKLPRYLKLMWIHCGEISVKYTRWGKIIGCICFCNYMYKEKDMRFVLN